LVEKPSNARTGHGAKKTKVPGRKPSTRASRSKSSKAPQPTPSESTADLGILFIHGIGTQKRSDTLLGFWVPVHRWILQWINAPSAITSGSSIASAEVEQLSVNADEPQAYRLTFVRRKQSRASSTWLIAEGWWAEDFHPPNWWHFALFLLRALPALGVWRLITRLIGLEKLWNQVGAVNYQEISALVRLAIGVAGACIVTAIELIVMLVLWPILMIAGVIPRARTFILAVPGDCFVACFNGPELEKMCAKVSAALEWLAHRSNRIAVVAHSQGGYLVERVLQDVTRESPSIAGKVRLVIGIGSGLGALRFMQLLSSWSRCAAGFLMWISLALLGVAQIIAITAITKATVEFTLPLLGFSLRQSVLEFYAMGLPLSGRASPDFSRVLLADLQDTNQEALRKMWPLIRADYALFGTKWFWFAVGVGVVGTLLFRRRASALMWEQGLRSTIGKKQWKWREYYTVHDIVNSTPMLDQYGATSTEVALLGSRADHTLYFRDSEHFLPCLVSDLCGISGNGPSIIRPDGRSRLDEAALRRYCRVKNAVRYRRAIAILGAMGVTAAWYAGDNLNARIEGIGLIVGLLLAAFAASYIVLIYAHAKARKRLLEGDTESDAPHGTKRASHLTPLVSRGRGFIATLLAVNSLQHAGGWGFYTYVSAGTPILGIPGFLPPRGYPPGLAGAYLLAAIAWLIVALLVWAGSRRGTRTLLITSAWSLGLSLISLPWSAHLLFLNGGALLFALWCRRSIRRIHRITPTGRS
jgi:hypothetical protein